MAATRKSSAATRKPRPAKAAPASLTKPTEARGFVPISGPDDPRAVQVLARVNELIAAKNAPKERAKPKGVRLSEETRDQVARDLTKLGMMFAAIERLSWLIDDGAGADPDDAASLAGSVALEAICKLGSWRADALNRALGDHGTGLFGDELARLAGARQ